MKSQDGEGYRIYSAIVLTLVGLFCVWMAISAFSGSTVLTCDGESMEPGDTCLTEHDSYEYGERIEPDRTAGFVFLGIGGFCLAGVVPTLWPLWRYDLRSWVRSRKWSREDREARKLTRRLRRRYGQPS
jgi:hypothetical protein